MPPSSGCSTRANYPGPRVHIGLRLKQPGWAKRSLRMRSEIDKLRTAAEEPRKQPAQQEISSAFDQVPSKIFIRRKQKLSVPLISTGLSSLMVSFYLLFIPAPNLSIRFVYTNSFHFGSFPLSLPLFRPILSFSAFFRLVPPSFTAALKKKTLYLRRLRSRSLTPAPPAFFSLSFTPLIIVCHLYLSAASEKNGNAKITVEAARRREGRKFHGLSHAAAQRTGLSLLLSSSFSTLFRISACSLPLNAGHRADNADDGKMKMKTGHAWLMED